MTMTVTMKYFLLPWSYIIFIQYAKQHTYNHYTISLAEGKSNVQCIKKKNIAHVGTYAYGHGWFDYSTTSNLTEVYTTEIIPYTSRNSYA